MYYTMPKAIPFAVLADAVKQFEKIDMVVPPLSGYMYNDTTEMWTLHFGLVSVNVFLG